MVHVGERTCTAMQEGGKEGRIRTQVKGKGKEHSKRQRTKRRRVELLHPPPLRNGLRPRSTAPNDSEQRPEWSGTSPRDSMKNRLRRFLRRFLRRLRIRLRQIQRRYTRFI